MIKMNYIRDISINELLIQYKKSDKEVKENINVYNNQGILYVIGNEVMRRFLAGELSDKGIKRSPYIE